MNTLNLSMNLEEAANQLPDKTFLIAGEQRLTYHQVERKVRQFANLLAGLNILPGERVGLLIPNTFEFVISYYGCLKYGAVPVVLATGGLVDTIVDCTPESLAAGTATGFSFQPYTASALLDCLRRALEAWQQRDWWRRLISTGMRQDWSWTRSAAEYVKLYERIHLKRTETVTV